jgi:hypothetical protein
LKLKLKKIYEETTSRIPVAGTTIRKWYHPIVKSSYMEAVRHFSVTRFPKRGSFVI